MIIIISQFQKCLKQYTTNNSYSFNIKLLLVKSLLITVIINKNNFIFERNMKILIKSLSFLSLITLFINDINAQSKFHHLKNATVRGTVYEKETGEPSFGTNVKIKGTGIGSSTDLNGFFQINRLSPGKVILEISNIEFKTIEEEIELKAGKIIIIEDKTNLVDLFRLGNFIDKQL